MTWPSLNSLLPPNLTDGMLPSWTLRFHVFMDGRDVSVKMRDIISSAVISCMFACAFLGSPEQIQGINTGKASHESARRVLRGGRCHTVLTRYHELIRNESVPTQGLHAFRHPESVNPNFGK